MCCWWSEGDGQHEARAWAAPSDIRRKHARERFTLATRHPSSSAIDLTIAKWAKSHEDRSYRKRHSIMVAEASCPSTHLSGYHHPNNMSSSKGVSAFAYLSSKPFVTAASVAASSLRHSGRPVHPSGGTHLHTKLTAATPDERLSCPPPHSLVSPSPALHLDREQF